MANSATLLADLLDRWTVPAQTTPEQHRGGGNEPTSEEFWTIHLQAARWLVEIEDSLTAMESMDEDVAHFRMAQPAWYGAVFTYGAQWGSSVASARPVADARDIALLRALGQQLDSVKYTPRVDSASVDSLRGALESARSLVAESTIDDSARRYLFGLVSEALDCLDELEAFGSVRLRAVTFELGGALSAMAETAVPEADKSKWREMALSVVRQIFVGVSVAVVTGVARQQMLGQ